MKKLSEQFYDFERQPKNEDVTKYFDSDADEPVVPPLKNIVKISEEGSSSKC